MSTLTSTQTDVATGVSNKLPLRDAEYHIQGLNSRYAECLDGDRLEEWPELFTEDATYKIHPRENYSLGLEGYWLYFDSKKMLRDRVLSLREANIYNIHVDRHLITNIRVAKSEGGIYTAKANYLILQTNNEGRTMVFSAGEYIDKIVFVSDTPKFKERVVIPDTYLAISLIAIPL